MSAPTQNGAVSRKTVHLRHPDSAGMTADHGNIHVAPEMHAIIEARMYGILWLYKSQRKATTRGGRSREERKKGKENRKDPGD